jgi:hypothetical protein
MARSVAVAVLCALAATTLAADVVIPDHIQSMMMKALALKEQALKMKATSANKAGEGQCFDNPSFAARLAWLLNVQLPEGNPCTMLANTGACAGPYKSLAAVICPASCSIYNDDMTLAQLAHQVDPSAAIDSCNSLISFFDTDPNGVCFGSPYSKYIRQLCPCLCQRPTLEYLGIPAEEPICQPWQYIHDNFDSYPDGSSPGMPNWMGGSAVVNGGKLCGTNHDSAMVYATCPLPDGLGFYFNWQAPTASGFEVYVLLASDSGQIGLIGCDGGFNGEGYCHPTIGTAWYDPSTDQLMPIDFRQNDPVALNVGQTYVLGASGNGGAAGWYLSDGTQNIVEMGAGIDLSFVQYVGLAIGRDPNGPTCVDDFYLSPLDNKGHLGKKL